MNRIKSLRISDLERKLYDFYSELEIVETTGIIKYYIGDKLIFEYFKNTQVLSYKSGSLMKYIDIVGINLNVVRDTFSDYHNIDVCSMAFTF